VGPRAIVRRIVTAKWEVPPCFAQPLDP
jgi:hypothetical protein